MQMSGLVGGAWLSLERHMAFSYPIVNEEEQDPVLQSGTRLKQTGQKWKSNMYIKSGKLGGLFGSSPQAFLGNSRQS